MYWIEREREGVREREEQNMHIWKKKSKINYIWQWCSEVQKILFSTDNATLELLPQFLKKKQSHSPDRIPKQFAQMNAGKRESAQHLFHIRYTLLKNKTIL